MSQYCPECGLTCSDVAVRCDCGHALAARTPEDAVRVSAPPRSPKGLLWWCAGIVLIASWMPWGTAGSGRGISVFGDAWETYSSLFHVLTPNWLAVLAALALALSRSVAGADMPSRHRVAYMTMPIYGLLHSGNVLLDWTDDRRGGIGIGILLTVAAYIVLVVAVVLDIRAMARAAHEDERRKLREALHRRGSEAARGPA